MYEHLRRKAKMQRFSRYFSAITLTSALIFGTLSGTQNHAPSPEEGLFVRRILEFWKDKDYPLVIAQTKLFLAQYPQSDFRESLMAILGDICWEQGNYKEALTTYDSLKKASLQEKVALNRMDCLYHLRQFSSLKAATKPHLPKDGVVQGNSDKQLIVLYYAHSNFEIGKTEKSPSEQALNYQEALVWYEKLLSTPHSLQARLALAEIYFALGKNGKSINQYMELAEAVPEKKEDMLMAAAKLQTEDDPDQALLTYTKVQQMSGKRSSEANLRIIALLFDQGRYRDIASRAKEFQKNANPQEQLLVNLMIGRSFYSLQEYEPALAYLKYSLRSEDEMRKQNNPADKSTVLTIVLCAHHLNDLSSTETLAKTYESVFDKDPSLAKILYILALTYKNCDRFGDSQLVLDRIASEFPTFEKMDTVKFEKCMLLYKQKFWGESRKEFISYVQNHSDSANCKQAWQFIPQTTFKMIEEAQRLNAPLDKLREQLIADLSLVINTPGAMPAAQRPSYHITLGKTMFELGKYQAARDSLQDYLERYPNDTQIYQAHLLLAMCSQEGFKDVPGFIQHAEKVLELKPAIAERDKLKVNLFNAYLQMANQSSEKPEERSALLQQAADHLYPVLMEGHESIDVDSQIWLANFYYQKARNGVDDFKLEPLSDDVKIEQAEKSLRIYLKGLALNPASMKLSISRDNLGVENEYLKLSNLWALLQEQHMQVALLKELAQIQKANPDWPWTSQQKVLFSLAKAYLQLGKSEQAIDSFHQVLSLKNQNSYLTNASKFHFAHLSYANMPLDKRNVNNPEMMLILKHLKDLQIRKSLVDEPLHLEAAMEYAHIRSSMEPLAKQDEQKRFLLVRLKQDFTSQDDLSSKDYQASRLKNPEKDLIYQAYMMLIDAQIAALDARIADAQGQKREKELKTEIAKSIYKNLLNSKFSVSKYLVDQAKSGIQDLD